MHRGEWLAERRAAVERTYSLEAPSYDEGYDPATPEHVTFVALLLDTSPPAGLILDAACGTGPYVGLALVAGRRVVGTDQSKGMLTRARSKHPDVRFDQIRLQELAFEGDFDAAMCIDAMENVPPEEWPGVLDNLRRAVRPSGFAVSDRRGDRATTDHLGVRGSDRGRLAFRLRRSRSGRYCWIPLLPRARSGPGLAHRCRVQGDPGRRRMARWIRLSPPTGSGAGLTPSQRAEAGRARGHGASRRPAPRMTAGASRG